MRIRRFCFIALSGILTACAGAPVQEMSDARQAIESAMVTGAEGHTNPTMREAMRLVEQAQQAIEEHRYQDAREMALEAKTKAISARIVVQQESLYPKSRQVE